MGGLGNVLGMKSELAAQVEAQVKFWIGGLQIVGSKSELAAQVRRGASACLFSCGWAG